MVFITAPESKLRHTRDSLAAWGLQVLEATLLSLLYTQAHYQGESHANEPSIIWRHTAQQHLAYHVRLLPQRKMRTSNGQTTFPSNSGSRQGMELESYNKHMAFAAGLLALSEMTSELTGSLLSICIQFLLMMELIVWPGHCC